MEIEVEHKINCVIIKLNGNLIEGPKALDFKRIIMKEIETKTLNFVVDLSNINYVNSTGLSILFRAYRTINSEGGKLKLANLSEKLNNLLNITKLNTLFDVEKTADDAIQNFK